MLLQQVLRNAEPIVMIWKERLYVYQPYVVFYMATLRALKQTHLSKEEVVCSCNYGNKEKETRRTHCFPIYII